MGILKLTVPFRAYKSLLRDLQINGIEYYSNTLTAYIVSDSSKVQMAIRMVKERFGAQSIKVTTIA